MVDCVLKHSNWYFYGNDMLENLILIGKTQILYELMTTEIIMYGKEIYKNEKIMYAWFQINREKISNHGFCLMKLSGMIEEHCSIISNGPCKKGKHMPQRMQKGANFGIA